MVSFRAVVLVEDGLQFRLDLIVLFFGDGTEDIVHFVFDTALALAARKFGFQGIEHGLQAISNPQVYMLHAPAFEIVKQLFPGILVLSVANPEAFITSLARPNSAAWLYTIHAS